MKIIGKFILFMSRFMSRACLALALVGGFVRTAGAEVSPAPDVGDAYTRWIVLNYNQYSAVDEYEFTSPQPGTWQPPVLENGTDVVAFGVTRNEPYCARLAVSFKAFGWGCYKIYNEHVAYRLWVLVDATQNAQESGCPEGTYAQGRPYSVKEGETISFRTKYRRAPCKWGLYNPSLELKTEFETENVRVKILPSYTEQGEFNVATVLVTGKKATGADPVRFYDVETLDPQIATGIHSTYDITVTASSPQPPAHAITASPIVKGQTLGNSTLSVSPADAGSAAWVDPGETMTAVGTQVRKAVFTAQGFDPVEEDVTVEVKPDGTFIPVTVTAVSAEKISGDADPAFTATVSGEVAAGDAISYAITRTPAGEDPGYYILKVTGDEFQLDKYQVTFVDGTLTIRQDTRPGYDAFRAAFTQGAGGSTFRLEKDFSCPGEELEQGPDNFTIDLNGHKITVGGSAGSSAPFAVGVGKTLTITDTSDSQTGGIAYVGTGTYIKFIDNSGTLNVDLNDGEAVDAANRAWNRAVMQREGAVLNVTGGTLKGYFGIYVQGTSTVTVQGARIGDLTGGTVTPIRLLNGASVVTLSNAVLQSGNPVVQAGGSDGVDASTVVLTDCTVDCNGTASVLDFDNGSTTLASITRGTVNAAAASALSNVKSQFKYGAGVTFNVMSDGVITEGATPDSKDISLKRTGEHTWISEKKKTGIILVFRPKK